MIVAIWSRLRLEPPSLQSRDPALDRAVKSRGAACLLAAGAIVAAVPAAAGAAGASRPVLVAVADAGLLLAALVLVAQPGWAPPLRPVVTIVAIGLIGTAVRFGGDAGPAFAVLYLWAALYAAYFHSLSSLVVVLALLAGASAAALLGSGAPLASWIITTAALVATAGLFRLVRDHPKRIDYLLARGLEITAAGIEALIGSDGVFASDHALVWSDCTTIATGEDADQTSTGDASART